MKKPLFSVLYILVLLTAGLTIHQAFAERSPAVDPMTEVSIEENRPSNNQAGFDFADQNRVVKPLETKRVPANIVTKIPSTTSSPYSLIGPIIFLLALPFALWIIVAKKMESTKTSEMLDYYPQNFQFKSVKTVHKTNEIEDDDQDFPKAS